MTKVPLENRLQLRERPQESVIMYQEWRDLLFLHWEYNVKEIQATLPPGLFVDTFDGKGYLTISPFSMENLSIVNLPSVPGFSHFIEVNARTYVYDYNGIPGIWFYSLDINSLMASNAARLGFFLPYYYTDIKREKRQDRIDIEGKRVDEPKADMTFAYAPKEGISHLAEPNTLDFFLLERYVLFSFSSNQLSLARVHHQPYPIKEVEVFEYKSNLLELQSLDVAFPPSYAHYSKGVDVEIFKMKTDKKL